MKKNLTELGYVSGDSHESFTDMKIKNISIHDCVRNVNEKMCQQSFIDCEELKECYWQKTVKQPHRQITTSHMQVALRINKGKQTIHIVRACIRVHEAYWIQNDNEWICGINGHDQNKRGYLLRCRSRRKTPYHISNDLIKTQGRSGQRNGNILTLSAFSFELLSIEQLINSRTEPLWNLMFNFTHEKYVFEVFSWNLSLRLQKMSSET